MGEDEKNPDRELLKLEYEECVSHGRFVIGIRFTFFVSFLTVFFVLMGAYHYIWATEPKVFRHLKPFVLLAAALFGLYTVIVAKIIERRNIQTYRTCDDRASILERMMGIQNGIRQVFASLEWEQRFLGIPMTHAVGISMFYWAVTLIWTLLILFSSYQLWFTFRL